MPTSEQDRYNDIVALGRAQLDDKDDDGLTFDPDPIVSEAENGEGAWVQAWVWVSFEGTGLDKSQEEGSTDDA